MSTFTRIRGYNTIYLPWRGFGFPNDLRPTPGSPELSYEEFFTALEAAGVNALRVKFVGWQRPLSTQALSLEPPPPGTFNPWAEDLDPANLTQYRNGQVSGPMSPALWQRSNLGQVITAAERHGVKLQVILFDNQEWLRAWDYHAWNANSRYVNGQACQQQDRGFLSDRRDVFTDPRAIDAAKARIDFLLQAFAGHDVVCAWEICAEMTWMLNRGYWGVDWNGLQDVCMTKAVPWVEEMARYVKARHPAPVGNGHVFAPSGFTGVAVARNEVYRTPSLDFALINWYGDRSMSNKVRQLRDAQQFIGKPVYVEQYAPWDLGAGAAYTREAATFPLSKAHEWAAACGEYGFVGPMRWPEIRGPVSTWWGTAHPNMAAIAGITRQMANRIDLSAWNGTGASFDDNITSTGLSLKSSWGDGEHVTMFLRWSSGGAKTITIAGLANRDYRFFLYDWITGNQVSTQDVTATGGTVVLTQVSTRDATIAGYLMPSAARPPVASFSGAPTSGETPLTVQFNDSSTGPITSWSWDFGDSSTSTEQNPSHTYNAAGTYTVQLSVDGPGGSDAQTRINYVTVTDPNLIPMIRLVFDDGDPSTSDIIVELRANSTYTVRTSTFEM